MHTGASLTWKSPLCADSWLMTVERTSSSDTRLLSSAMAAASSCTQALRQITP